MADSDFPWDQLLNLIEEEKVVPIIGQALLTIQYQGRKGLLYPLLAHRLVKHKLGEDDGELPSGDELNEVAYRYHASGKVIAEIYSDIKTVFPPKDELQLPASLLQLADIRPFKLFLTTTFDPLLVRALDQVRHDGQEKTRVRAYAPDERQDVPEEKNFDQPVVYHLFGKISATPESYAVTQEDFLEFLHALQSKERQPERLFHLLNKSSLLIIGSCFSGWLARFFLRTTKRERLSRSAALFDYVADERIRGDKDLVIFLSTFCRCTRVYENGDPAAFVAELHRRWRERPSPPREPPASRPGAVFLSYASEDREAVAKIKDTFEAKGIDVFFDKADLRAGEDFEAKIRRAIAECSLFMPVISRATLTMKSKFFRLEWAQALRMAPTFPRTRRFIVPVVIDGTRPEEEAISDDIRRLHWEETPGGMMRPEFATEVRQLVRQYHKDSQGGPQ